MAYSAKEISDIRAHGMVQAVISSGLPAEKWKDATTYGLMLAGVMADRLNKKKRDYPAIPATLKERK